MTSPDTTALQAAIEPIAAYCARTPAPNVHADRCAALVNAAVDYVEEVEAAEAARAAEPDWRALAYRMVAALEFPPCTHPLVLRCRALLDSPRLHAKASLSLAQRMYLAQITSHYLGRPSSL